MPMASLFSHAKKLANRVLGIETKAPREPNWWYGYFLVRYFAPYTSDETRRKMLGSYAIEGITLHEEKKRHERHQAADKEMEQALGKHKATFDAYKTTWQTHQNIITELNKNSEADEKRLCQDLKNAGITVSIEALKKSEVMRHEFIDDLDKKRLKMLSDFARLLYVQYPKLRLSGKKEDRQQDIIDINDYLHQRAVFQCMRVKEDEPFSPYGYEDYLGPEFEPPVFSNTIGYLRIAWFIINPCLWGDFLVDQTLGNIAWGWSWGVNAIVHKGADFAGWCFNGQYRYSKGAYAAKLLFNLPAIILLIPEMLTYTCALYTNSGDIWKETFSCNGCTNKISPGFTEDDPEWKAREVERRKKQPGEKRRARELEQRQKEAPLRRLGSSGHINQPKLEEATSEAKIPEAKRKLDLAVHPKSALYKEIKIPAKLARSNSQPNLHVSQQGMFQKTAENKTLERKNGLHGRRMTRVFRAVTGLRHEKNGVPFQKKFRTLPSSSSNQGYNPTLHAKSVPASHSVLRARLTNATFEPPTPTAAGIRPV